VLCCVVAVLLPFAVLLVVPDVGILVVFLVVGVVVVLVVLVVLVCSCSSCCFLFKYHSCALQVDGTTANEHQC
jgi:hypothetical protein